jgi:hypothetical protein
MTTTGNIPVNYNTRRDVRNNITQSFNKNIVPLARSLPTPNPTKGEVKFDNTTNDFYGWDGSQWIQFGGVLSDVSADIPIQYKPQDIWIYRLRQILCLVKVILL